VDRANGVNWAESLFNNKAQIRRTIEAEGIPHTFVVANFFAGHFLPNLSGLRALLTPTNKVIIFGDGNPKGI